MFDSTQEEDWQCTGESVDSDKLAPNELLVETSEFEAFHMGYVISESIPALALRKKLRNSDIRNNIYFDSYFPPFTKKKIKNRLFRKNAS